MSKRYTIGIDIGGSHISCAVMDTTTHELLKETLQREHLSHTDTAEEIIKTWARAINNCLKTVAIEQVAGLGFAIPGPFDYGKGISLMEHKYPNLYQLHIPSQLEKHLVAPLPMRFLNDASAFAVGVAWIDKAKGFRKAIALTLGTGFGSAYLQDGIPVVSGENIAPEGCFWHLPFKNGIADEYFSTRWFTNTYQSKTGQSIKGVKEILDTPYSQELFDEFGHNLGEFLAPWLKKFGAEIVVLGGNIALAYAHFERALTQKLLAEQCATPIVVSSLMEDVAMAGAARVFDETFWQKLGI